MQSCNVQSADEARALHAAHALRWLASRDGRGQGRASAAPSQTQLELWVLGEDPPENPTVRAIASRSCPTRRSTRPARRPSSWSRRPSPPPKGVLTLRRDGVVHLERFHLDKKTTTLQREARPGVDAQRRSQPWSSWARAFARTRAVPPIHRCPSVPPPLRRGATLSSRPRPFPRASLIKPEKKALEPGGSTKIGARRARRGRARGPQRRVGAGGRGRVGARARGLRVAGPARRALPVARRRRHGVRDAAARRADASPTRRASRCSRRPSHSQRSGTATRQDVRAKKADPMGEAFGYGGLGLSGVGEGGGGRGDGIAA